MLYTLLFPKKVDKRIIEKITMPKEAADILLETSNTASDVYQPFKDAISRSLKVTKLDNNKAIKMHLSLDYNFNQKIFNNFLDDVKNGFHLTNINRSHIFYISLTATINGVHQVYHSCVLEQLWDENLKKNRIMPLSILGQRSNFSHGHGEKRVPSH